MSRRWPRIAAAAAAVLVGVFAGGCSSDNTRGGIPAAAYVAALGPFLPEPPADDDTDPAVVYVAPLGESPLALDAQVAVIDALVECCDVRFVDTVDVAIDDGSDGAPPRDHGLLLAIGTILAESPHTVRVEEYTDAQRTAAHLVTVVERAGAWAVSAVDEVDPEVLVGDG